ncbi:MAG: cytochrome c oxidase assembly protein [Gemmatimonadaceae bacterium]|nr:cytochrome c oxidase assembly protein [Gemmatimonadaceae bacterium]
MSRFALLHSVVALSWSSFSIHPSTVIGIAALAAIYVWRASVEKRRDLGTPLKSSTAAAFASGLLLLFLSLNGPLHDLSDDYLFSAHMVQHLLLTLAVPPLLIAGTPGWMLRPALRNRQVASVARFVTKPFACFTIFNLVIIAWHLPPLYNLAMANHNIHIAEHLMFLAGAVLMWWPFLSPLPELPRLSYPGQMLYSFLMSIPMSVVAVSITMADHILYPAYAAAPRVLAITPLEDQLMGGLIMWIPGGFIFVIIMTVVFFKWNARGEDSAAGAQVDWNASTAKP